MRNLNIDLHRVAKVVEDQVLEIDKAVKRANDAMDQANKATDNSNVNKASIKAVNEAVAEAKSSALDALTKIEGLATNDVVQDIKKSLDSATADVAKLKQSQADQLEDVTGQINDAVTKAKAAVDSVNARTDDLQVAVKNAQSDATVATQTAKEANLTAIDAKGNAAVAVEKANQVTVDMKNAKNDILAIKATADNASITAGNAASDATTAKATAQGASLVATNAKDDVAKVSATVNDINATVTGINKNVDGVAGKVTKAQTELDQTKNALRLKADQTTVDNVKKTADQNSATLGVLSNEIKSKVDNTTVDKLIDSKGLTTASTVQSLIDQKANQISQTITDVKLTVDKNGKEISSTNDRVSNLTQTIDGLQTSIKNKADQSQINQLSNQITAKVSVKDYQSEIVLLNQNLNLRVKKGDVISQINQEAGGPTLIEVANGKGKLLLDADSVVFKNKAFIPSAAIIDIAADKITSGTLDAGNIRVINLTADTIHGGTLDVGDMNIKNLTANDITTGTLTGVVIKSDNKKGQNFTLDGATMVWRNKESAAVVGRGFITDMNSKEVADEDSFSIMADKEVVIGGGIIVDDDNQIEPSVNDTTIRVTNGFREKLIPNYYKDYCVELHAGQGASMRLYDRTIGDPNDALADYDTIRFTSIHNVEFNLGSMSDHINGGLDDTIFNSSFNIQKDNKIGAYFGQGTNGNEINFATAGDGGAVNVNTQLNANSLNVTGYKHSVVKTSQGYLGINAYETAEYYFGDIGENSTGDSSQVVIGIDQIFNETVNTTIPYQVFITPYSDCHVWVDQRYDNRFVVKSDKPNAQFAWEIKAKRKGYESDRLRHIDGIKEKGEIKV